MQKNLTPRFCKRALLFYHIMTKSELLSARYSPEALKIPKIPSKQPRSPSKEPHLDFKRAHFDLKRAILISKKPKQPRSPSKEPHFDLKRDPHYHKTRPDLNFYSTGTAHARKRGVAQECPAPGTLWCCSVLQCVAVWCRVLQSDAVCVL